MSAWRSDGPPQARRAVPWLLLCSLAAAGEPWLRMPGGWLGPEGDFYTDAKVSFVAAELAALHAAPKRSMDPAAKLPGHVDPSQTRSGEGYFAVVGDWGNPFHPGTADGASAAWGPHWKCFVMHTGGPRCQVGSKEWQRDEYAQTNVSKALTDYAKQHSVQFVINVGDNLYPAGYDSPTDFHWQYVFEERYPDPALQVPWLSVLGNHDWGGFDCYLSPDGKLTRGNEQIAYDTEHAWEWPSSKASRWVLPDWHYKKRITFGNTTMDFFMFDSNFARVEEPCGDLPYAHKKCDLAACKAYVSKMADISLKFLKTELPASDADWKIVVAHHPIDSLGRWGGPQDNVVELMQKNNVSLYLCGHVHYLAEFWYAKATQRPWDSTETKRPGAVMQLVSGAGGGSYSDGPVQNLGPWGANGVKVTKTTLTIDYISDHGDIVRSVEVATPCAQLWGSRCQWETTAWSPAQPCCSANVTSNCTKERRTRQVRCAGGPEDRCSNTPRPEADEDCAAVQPDHPGHGRRGLSRPVVIGLSVGAGAAALAAAGGAVFAFLRRRRGSGARQALLNA